MSRRPTHARAQEREREREVITNNTTTTILHDCTKRSDGALLILSRLSKNSIHDFTLLPLLSDGISVSSPASFVSVGRGIKPPLLLFLPSSSHCTYLFIISPAVSFALSQGTLRQASQPATYLRLCPVSHPSFLALSLHALTASSLLVCLVFLLSPVDRVSDEEAVQIDPSGCLPFPLASPVCCVAHFRWYFLRYRRRRGRRYLRARAAASRTHYLSDTHERRTTDETTQGRSSSSSKDANTSLSSNIITKHHAQQEQRKQQWSQEG